MKVYTGTGDEGKTSLFSGERIYKSNPRIETCGDVDELNSVLGVVAAHLSDTMASAKNDIAVIQSQLFDIGAWVATTADSPRAASLTRIDESMWGSIEQSIDRMEEDLPRLTGFVIPGGTPAAAWSHVARTVCRRAERRVVELAQTDLHPDYLSGVLIYLNRLSDYLFVLARYLNHHTGDGDHLWHA